MRRALIVLTVALVVLAGPAGAQDRVKVALPE